MTQTLPVAIVGAGPVGLAAAAHLLSRGLRPVVLEAGDGVAANVRDWGHVRLFSPWRYNIDRAAARLLEATGWRAPAPDGMPTGAELISQYLEPLSRVPALADAIRFDRRVVAVTRLHTDKVTSADREALPFIVRTRDREGNEEEVAAHAVIDASGTWATPNPIGASGVAALGEKALANRVHYGIPDVLGAKRDEYAGRMTLVVGAGHSAANSILALAELAREVASTRIIWTTRGEALTRVFGGGAADELPARGKLGTDLKHLVDKGALRLVTGFKIREIRRFGTALTVLGTRRGGEESIDGVDSIIAATGQRPDLGILRELRLDLHTALECAAALGPLIDPNIHSCGTVRPHGAKELRHTEENFYLIGGKSYGRAPTFLLATGYEQARSVAAMLAGDREAAARVELQLPETGVCNSGQDDAANCCSPTAKDTTSSCGAPRTACC
jgi:thioredoxin reductase